MTMDGKFASSRGRIVELHRVCINLEGVRGAGGGGWKRRKISNGRSNIFRSVQADFFDLVFRMQIFRGKDF